MSFLPIPPAAPASAMSGPDLSLVPKESASPSGPEDQGDSSFEDALARSSTEEKRHDLTDATEPSVMVGMLPPLAPLAPVPVLEVSDPIFLQQSGMGEPVENLSPGLWMSGAQPSPEQPLPISKPWVQTVYQNPDANTLVNLGNPANPDQDAAAPGAGESLNPVECLSPASATPVEAAPSESKILHPSGSALDPAKTAPPGTVAGAEFKPEQIALVSPVQNPDEAEKNASLSGTKTVQVPKDPSETSFTQTNRQNSDGDTGRGMGSAAERRSMSVSLLQPKRVSDSKESVESPGEGLRVFTGRAGKENADSGNAFEEAVDGSFRTETAGASDGLSRGPSAFQTGSSLAEGTPGLHVAPAAQVSPSVHSAGGGPAQPDAARVLEHLEATLAKYRPNVPPHLELQVDLLGGDTLDVRLDLRGEALQSTFRTDSPELRLALQRAWPEFAERSLQQGLNLAPASFDSAGTFPDSGSGAQADGRRQTSKEGEGPLPEAFRKAPSQFSGKVSEPAQGTRQPGRTRWA